MKPVGMSASKGVRPLAGAYRYTFTATRRSCLVRGHVKSSELTCTTETLQLENSVLERIKQSLEAPTPPSDPQPLLASVFGFEHLSRPSELHTGSEATLLANLFIDFAHSLEVATRNGYGATGTQSWHAAANSADLDKADVDALRKAAATLQSGLVTWYPEFGCALLAHGSTDGTASIRARPGDLSLLLVCLDKWEFHLHSSPGASRHTAVCDNAATLYCGAVRADRHAELLNLVNAIVADLEKKKKEKKGTGFQRTPAFMRSVVEAAVRALASKTTEEEGIEGIALRAPRGGFTDVGIHTGGDAVRDTCWPLVQQVLQVVLELCGAASGPACRPSALLRRLALAHLRRWLLGRRLAHLTPEAATPEAVNAVMQMLEATAAGAAELADEGYGVAGFEAACAAAHQQLTAAVQQRALRAARALELPAPGEVHFQEYTVPTGVLPPPYQPSADDGGLEGARRRAAVNLGSLQLLPVGASMAQLLDWLQNQQLLAQASGGSGASAASAAAQLLLRGVERELFTRAASSSFAMTAGQLAAGEVPVLEAVVDEYRAIMLAFLESGAGGAVMRVELQSRELLVAWTAYCMIHQAVGGQYVIVQEYGVALQYSDLRHLALSDRRAQDAALGVAAYLKRCSKAGRELFSLRDGGTATFQMAEAFVKGTYGAAMRQVWQEERAAADARVDAHWAEVRHKQQLAARLRRAISITKAEGASLQSRLSSKEQEQNTYGRYDTRYATLATDISNLNDDIYNNSSKQHLLGSELQEAEKAPPPVVQPLPSQEGLAFRWLFFLCMPPLLRNLSRASFLAQQLLLPSLKNKNAPSPRDKQILDAIAVPSHATSLVGHYNKHQNSPANAQYHQPSRQRTGSDGRVAFMSCDKVPEQIGPKLVDQCASRSDGVWYPDGLTTKMAWTGSGAAADAAWSFLTYFNPFSLPDAALVVCHFTEALPKGAEALQWAMPQDGGSTFVTRGNVGIAEQDTKPSWLNKPEFLDFARLRSYPLGQLRRLAAALHDRTLPPAHPAVQTLVRQTLYHLGTLTDAAPPGLLWRAGWEQPGGVLAALCAELAALADELDQKPRDHDAVLLLGEVAAYLSDWHAPCRPLARRFAAMTSRAADELEQQINRVSGQAGGGDEVAQTAARQARQSQLRMTSLLCYGASGLLEAADVEHMVRLMVLINHGRVFQDDEVTRQALDRLHVRAQSLMSSRIAALVEEARGRPQLLTKAIGAVLGRVPDSLRWVQLAGAAASFEAVGIDDNLYSINILTGAVLLNGWPPGRLPAEITTHPLFRRTFGDCNFEVSLQAARVLRTNKPVSGRFYDFAICAEGKQLTVTELEDSGSKHDNGLPVWWRLELLDVGPGQECAGWGEELPVRLRELHSHWLCRDDNVMVLRPPNFQSHDSWFVISCGAGLRGSLPLPAPAAGHRLPYDCRRVPPHLRPKHWTALLEPSRLLPQLTDRLVLLGSCHTKDAILAKFEHPSFIHTYINSSPAAHGNGSVPQTGIMRAANGSAIPSSVSPTPPPHELLFELPRFRLEFELRAGGQVASLDWRGYVLCRRQLLVDDGGGWGQGSPVDGNVGVGGNGRSGVGSDGEVLYTLPEFRDYLLLERDPGGVVAPGDLRADVLVLVPAGSVAEGVSTGGGRPVRVQVDGGSGAELNAHCYEAHGRFGHLRAPSTPARLQLAALYAATASRLPEPASRATGAQTAAELLRQCWGDRPLGGREAAQLAAVGRLAGHLAPALRLLAHDIAASAAQQPRAAGPGPAAPGGGEEEETPSGPQLEPDAVSAYLQSSRQGALPGGWLPNPRQALTACEEERIAGVRRGRRQLPAWVRRRHFTPVEVAEQLPVEAQYVADMEAMLKGLVVVSAGGGSAAVPSYPLATGTAAATPLEAEMHAELEGSWAAHHGTPGPDRMEVVGGARDRIRGAQADVQQRRAAVEAYLLRHLTNVPLSVGRHGAAFRLLRLAASAPSPGLLDLLRAAWQPELLARHFNPFLSEAAQAALHGGVLTWLQLCVLEDRLGRLGRLAGAGPEYRTALVQELLVHRTWDAAHQPQWLVFEAEGRLQIRPAQHALAAQLLANPGAIAQLNMGEGKTRVILPMLALAWADGSQIVRLHFLSPLLDEAYAHLHAHLTASVLGRKLFTAPFHRDVRLTPGGAAAMRASLEHCRRAGGLLLLAPEHRLSLELKWHELRPKPLVPLELQGDSRSAACAAVLQDIFGLPYRDLLDESDELLHHRYQLVYACGDASGLPAIDERIRAAQALLRALARLAAAGAPVPLLPADAAVVEPPEAAGRCPGSFPALRLLPGAALEGALPALHRRLAEAVLDAPPYEMRWLERHPMRDALGGPGAASALSAEQLSHVLALRGLLAQGLLVHCLQKRHRVEYGVNRRPGARKRLAVPFRAADLPSERSEFAQPDVALLLTCLAYYGDGLSRGEFKDALVKLLGMGRNAQRAYYRDWLEVAGEGSAADRATFRDVDAVDPTNPAQLAAMHAYFRANTAVVDFWLNFCVFPSETQQFPARLAASAWHLADNSRGALVGFSGTNDSHRLLPLQVRQAEAAEPLLAATNGKMLAAILDNPDFQVLEPQSPAQPGWQAVLDLALGPCGAHALIDCGALLAGVTNRQAADYVLASPHAARFKGACYYDAAARCWVVADARGGRSPRAASPIAERDTFVIFDDARCRGADLQLLPRAVGVLTLGPGACKDKVMQAAGRLRQLGRGRQTLRFVAPADVAARIRAASGLGEGAAVDSRHVLRWVMANTVAATLRGVSEWAHQGLHFAATHGAPERALVDEVLELRDMYGAGVVERPVGEVVGARAAAVAERCAGDLTDEMRALMEQVGQRAARYGEGHAVIAGAGVDEECERELEQEEEEEQEVEKQVPRVEAAPERDWPYAAALQAGASPATLPADAGVVSLRQAAAFLQPQSVCELAWSADVFVTHNFLHATAQPGGGGGRPAVLNEYLRPVDAMLLFPATAQLLLLSEREADGVLAAMRAAGGAAGGGANGTPVLLSLPYARQAAAAGGAGALPPLLAVTSAGTAAATRTSVALPAAPLVSVALYDGQASYGAAGAAAAAAGDQVMAALRALVGGRREAVEALVAMRGKQALLPRSDLERACEG